ncbi:hypothetical protein [Pseudogulbenkiania sp. MAI-1]|uniref:hypothetical protein n=1 Tax=Pseudogulbenkiania sp. MAI-1 TaxID=990370 RepID=UPI00045EA17F|nr:hypothetical protein [Pseudogulbenkiania sp. MAI-1]
MKAVLAFLALVLSASAMAATPRDDAVQLLAWLKHTRAEINRAGRAGDTVALQRIQREAVRRSDAWPNDLPHAPFMDCHTALTDQVSFLQAYQRKDYPWRDRQARHFRDDLASCERAVK